MHKHSEATPSLALARLNQSPAGDCVHKRMYAEYDAGGFAPSAHFVSFYNRVNALVGAASTVLDYGAGRGKFSEMEVGWKLHLCSLKGRCSRFIGADVDPVVLSNPMTDENLIIGADGRIPLPDRSVDVITSWAVFEHVANPQVVAGELDRILRPGGWICAWTPNKWGYVGIAARAVPASLQQQVLRYVGVDGRKEIDVFPVAYRMNTRRALKRLFPTDRFQHHVGIHNGPPGYHAGSIVLARLIQVYGTLMPPAARAMLHVFLRKLP